MSADAYQVLSDCPHCLVEAAVVEILDPAHPATHLGLAVEVRCRLCTWTVQAEDEPFAPRTPLSLGRCPACARPLDPAARAGRGPCPECGYRPRTRETTAPLDLTWAPRALAELTRWSRDEGEPDVDVFSLANMGRNAAEVVAMLGRRERVPTTFDVVAWLFPANAAGRSTGDARPAEVVDRAPEAPRPTLPVVSPLGPDPRAPARVLVSVMLADGELREGERRFVDAFLAAGGMSPVEPADLRVWRPHELGPPPPSPLRDQVLEACVHLMHLDGRQDGSEWRVVEAYARAWGVSAEQLAAWDRDYDLRYATTLTRLWRGLSTWVRPG